MDLCHELTCANEPNNCNVLFSVYLSNNSQSMININAQHDAAFLNLLDDTAGNVML